MNLDEYRAWSADHGVKAPLARPEHQLQVRAVAWLTKWLKPDVFWIAGAAGLRLGWKVLEDARASGVLRPGWPDLSFFCPDGVTRFIELKSKTGSLEAEQRDFRDAAKPFGIWALCRSLEAIIEQVKAWGLVREGAPCR